MVGTRVTFLNSFYFLIGTRITSIILVEFFFTIYVKKRLILCTGWIRWLFYQESLFKECINCRFMEPLTIGDYPNSMRSLVGSRLPKFSTYQAQLVRGSFDFIGLNYYTSFYATNAPQLSEAMPSYLTDSLVIITSKCIFMKSQ